MGPGSYVKRYNDILQFLELFGSSGISSTNLNKGLSERRISNDFGSAFCEASRQANVNELYLATHVLHETRNGTFQLITSIVYNGKIVYNISGFGVVDSNPIGGESRTAYENEWFTPEAAIIGGAKWISGRYINHSSYKQDTLYKMRWNLATLGLHKYVTDIN